MTEAQRPRADWPSWFNPDKNNAIDQWSRTWGIADAHALDLVRTGDDRIPRPLLIDGEPRWRAGDVVTFLLGLDIEAVTPEPYNPGDVDQLRREIVRSEARTAELRSRLVALTGGRDV